MKTDITTYLLLFSILNSLIAFKLKVKQDVLQNVLICNYAYLDNQNQTDPSLQNRLILGNASYFGVLAATRTTNHGNTTVVGSLGVFPSASIDGDNITLIGGTFHRADKEAQDAQNSLTIAYNYLSNRTTEVDLTGTDLSGLVLLPGVYEFSSSAFLSAGPPLILNGNGLPNAEWVFKIGSTLITSVGSKIEVIGGGSPYNVYWKVGSSASIKGNTTMVGNIVTLTSISFGTIATLQGRALARNGAITMLANNITSVPCRNTSNI